MKDKTDKIVGWSAGIGYIAFWTGLSVASIGQMPKTPAEPFDWWMPVLMLGLLIPVFIFGWLARGEDE